LNKLRYITENAIKDQENKYVQEQLNLIKELCTNAANNAKSSVFYESQNKLNAYDVFFRDSGLQSEYGTFVCRGVLSASVCYCEKNNDCQEKYIGYRFGWYNVLK